LSFWEVDPAQAVYYFSRWFCCTWLRDAPATLRWSVIAKPYSIWKFAGRQGGWCSAQQQYELALQIRGDSTYKKVQVAAEKCAGITPPQRKDGYSPVAPTRPAI